MTIRPAKETDIPFIVNAILEIERCENGNTFTNLFGCSMEQSADYLTNFFFDEENLDTEFSLNTYIIAEIDGNAAGCSSLISTDQNYYQSKAELFPIHLAREHLLNLSENVKKLPDTHLSSENRYFAEYIFTNENFRGKGVAKAMISHLIETSSQGKISINVLANNQNALRYYEKLGFEPVTELTIDPEKTFYPSDKKIILEGHI